MNREQFEDLGKHKVGRLKKMTNTGVYDLLYNPATAERPVTPQKRQGTITVPADLKPRAREHDDCRACEGSGLEREVTTIRKRGSTGNRRYIYKGRCPTCGGSGKNTGRASVA